MIKSFKYTIKIWLTAATVPPFIFCAISCCIDPLVVSNNIAAYYWILVVSLITSFFTWIFFFIAVYNILKLEVSGRRHKLMIQMFGLVLALATFVVFAIGLGSIRLLGDLFFWDIVVPYLACLAASIHFYKLPQPYIEHQENPTT